MLQADGQVIGIVRIVGIVLQRGKVVALGFLPSILRRVDIGKGEIQVRRIGLVANHQLELGFGLQRRNIGDREQRGHGQRILGIRQQQRLVILYRRRAVTIVDMDSAPREQRIAVGGIDFQHAIVTLQGQRMITGTGDEVYVRRLGQAMQDQTWLLYNVGEKLRDPESGELLANLPMTGI